VSETKVKVDIARNRLYVTIGSSISKQSMEELYTDVRFGVADLKSGFAIVNDMSNCTLAALAGVRTFKKIMDYVASNEVEQVIRVVNENSIIFKQILNLTSRMQKYKAIHVSTIEEAEAKLEILGRRRALRFYLQQQPIEYMIGDAKGEGLIYNISTSGCAVTSATLAPSADDTIQTSFIFNEAGNLLSEFKISARVVRVESSLFAVEFMELDTEFKDQLRKRLVHESQCEVPQNMLPGS
jgi:D-ribose pyranose/furanose isomerase RbsD